MLTYSGITDIVLEDALVHASFIVELIDEMVVPPEEGTADAKP